MNTFIIRNVKIVTPFSLIDNGFVYIKKGVIEAIAQMAPLNVHRSCSIIDGSGLILMPGIIDICNTIIDQSMNSGVESISHLEEVFFETEKLLYSHGITTAYHIVSERNQGWISELNKIRKSGIIRHHILQGISVDEYYTRLNSSWIRHEIQNSPEASEQLKCEILKSTDQFALCSDNESSSILYSASILKNKLGIDIWKLSAMLSLNPAKASRTSAKYGSIEYGKTADFILIKEAGDSFELEMAFISGCKVYGYGKAMQVYKNESTYRSEIQYECNECSYERSNHF